MSATVGVFLAGCAAGAGVCVVVGLIALLRLWLSWNKHYPFLH